MCSNCHLRIIFSIQQDVICVCFILYTTRRHLCLFYSVYNMTSFVCVFLFSIQQDVICVCFILYTTRRHLCPFYSLYNITSFVSVLFSIQQDVICVYVCFILYTTRRHVCVFEANRLGQIHFLIKAIYPLLH